MFYGDGGWWIEDLGSAAGTSVDGRVLPAHSPQRIGSGTILRFAEREALFLHAETVHARIDGVDLFAEVNALVSLSSTLAGLEPLCDLRLYNASTARSGVSTWEIALGAYWSATVAVPALDPGESRTLPRPIARIDRAIWWRLSAPVEARFEVRDAIRQTTPVPLGPGHVHVVPAGCWVNSAVHGLGLVSFVAPGHERIVRAAAEIAAGLAVSATAEATAEAVFAYLSERWSLVYRHEPGGIARGVQRIRPPDEVLGDPVARRGQGTCIDLALVSAGILEALGACPSIAVVDDGSVRHAIVGCRAARGTSTPADLLASENIWFDPNGVTVDPSWRCDFHAARARAAAALAAARPFVVVDVAAARDLGVASLSFPEGIEWQGDAAGVVRKAAQLGAERGCELGTPVLLAAVLLEMERRNPAGFLRAGLLGAGQRLAARLRARSQTERPSVNYRSLLARAEAIAAGRNPRVVDFPILVDALRMTPSTALDAALAYAGCDRDSLRILIGRDPSTSTDPDDDLSRF